MDQDHRRVPNSTTKDQKKCNKARRKDENSLKVVYISTPMKVRTSSTRFRTLVQKLTGKNSDMAGYMDTHGTAPSHEFRDDSEFLLANEASGHPIQSSISSDDTTTTTTPTTSGSFVGPTYNAYTYQMEGQFASEYYSCYDPCQLEVLGSYDDLIM